MDPRCPQRQHILKLMAYFAEGKQKSHITQCLNHVITLSDGRQGFVAVPLTLFHKEVKSEREQSCFTEWGKSALLERHAQRRSN